LIGLVDKELLWLFEFDRYLSGPRRPMRLPRHAGDRAERNCTPNRAGPAPTFPAVLPARAIRRMILGQTNRCWP